MDLFRPVVQGIDVSVAATLQSQQGLQARIEALQKGGWLRSMSAGPAAIAMVLMLKRILFIFFCTIAPQHAQHTQSETPSRTCTIM